MNVSHFELIFKPQSPVPPADTVLQGYFLSISNLEEKALSFRLDLVTSPVSDPMRTLAGNTTVIVDVAGTNNDFSYSLSGSAASKSFRLNRFITIPAHATAKVAILPADPFPEPIGDGTGDPADYEARGYVTLRLPSLLVANGQFLSFEAQLDRPANVLLTPQNRATYFRDGEVIESQTQAGLPLASGSALNQIEAESGFPFPIFENPREFELIDSVANLDLDRAPEALAELIAVAAASDIDTKAFNAALKEAGIGMAIERRKVTAPDTATNRVTEDA
ncbi:hypothetical protein [Gymnodinialimonas hymeniacidonis]|uniref:hypothetical protein n=1 Tax=Gymnodinialimonas hymeniacidonis TaxID=3126508 RepID=UPI0034C618A9